MKKKCRRPKKNMNARSDVIRRAEERLLAIGASTQEYNSAHTPLQVVSTLWW